MEQFAQSTYETLAEDLRHLPEQVITQLLV